MTKGRSTPYEERIALVRECILFFQIFKRRGQQCKADITHSIRTGQGIKGLVHASANLLVNAYAHIQQDSRKKLGKKFEEGFYKPGTTSVQTAPIEAEPTISVSALLELLNDTDPSVKAQLRLALLT